MKTFETPLLIIASGKDIFFPADRVFKSAEEIFKGPITKLEIDSKHLPSETVMAEICRLTLEYLK